MSHKSFDLEQYIMAHVLNSQEWHLPFLPPIHLPSYLSRDGLMLILCSLILIILFVLVYRKKESVPRGMTNFLEVLIVFIRDQIAKVYLGEKDGRMMTPFLCTLFFFILGLNLLGMIPLFSTATANVNVTGALAMVTLCFMIFGAIKKNGLLGFVKALTPSGVPWPSLLFSCLWNF